MHPPFTRDNIRDIKTTQSSRVCGYELESTIKSAARSKVFAELHLFRAKVLAAATDRAAPETPALELALRAP